MAILQFQLSNLQCRVWCLVDSRH